MAILGFAAAVVAGCGPEHETVVDLLDYAAHQRDQVTTGVVSPTDEVTARLAANGWRISEPRRDGSSAFAMRRERGRVWFFSADGSTRGVELVGGLARAQGARGRRINYRLNGSEEGHFSILPGLGEYTLPFSEESVRPGWNALDLRLRRTETGGKGPVVRVRGFKFLTDEGRTGRGGRRIERADNGLAMPAGSLYQVAFEVPESARFSAALEPIQVQADAPLNVTVILSDDAGGETKLAEISLESEATSLDVSLEPWQGQLAQLGLMVQGAEPASVLWREARVTGTDAPKAEPFGQLIRPRAIEPSTRLGRPNVLIVLLDAARADAFSPWGGPHETPALEELVAHGTKFERALTPSSWTGQTVPSVLTGFYPDAIGIRQWGSSLPEIVPTVTELLAGAGYQTTLWSQHPIYSRGPTFARGFEHQTYSGSARPELLPRIDDLFDSERPSFAFVHLLPPHAPYTPPPPFLMRYSGWYQGTVPRAFKLLGKFPNKRDPAEFDADDRKFVRDRYQENVAFADHLVGTLIEQLKASGRFDDTLVAVISDHGEAFLEHDHFLHSARLYREFIHVPFVVKWPASATGYRKEVAETVSLVDLAPTLVAGLGIEGPQRGFQGIDLMPSIFGEAPEPRSFYAITRGDSDPQRPPKRWVRFERDGWAVIWDQLGGRHELYDLENDPDEQKDLATEHPTLALSLLQDLQIQRSFNSTLFQLGADEAGELDPALEAELKALGYL